MASVQYIFFSLFQFLASLFVLSVVAEPEAEPQHHTSGFTAYINGALVPEVKIISDQHYFKYRKVANTSLSCLEAHAGFFRLSMKGKSDVYLM